MRNMLFAVLAALFVSAGSGCCWCHGWGHKGCGDQCCDQGCSYCGPHSGACGPGGCKNGYGGGCGQGSCGPAGCDQAGCFGGPRAPCSPVPDCATGREAVAAQLGGPAGPPAAQITYPYYTTRGPRDYFAAHPPSIGP